MKSIEPIDNDEYGDIGPFFECSHITHIFIPNTVTSIGDWAFDGCSSLTNITIPNSVTSIGYWVFSGCSSLANINIPKRFKKQFGNNEKFMYF